MDGPAVYPTTAPATAPTGPNTTAPETAPKAASLPRPWANAIAGANVKNIADARTSLFIYGSNDAFWLNTHSRIAAQQWNGPTVLRAIDDKKGASPAWNEKKSEHAANSLALFRK